VAPTSRYDAIDSDDEGEVFRLAELVLAKGCVLEQQRDPGGRGMNPLHYAVVGSRANAVRALCQLGVSVEACMPSGRNAVHLAVQHRSVVSLAILADFGGQAAFLARDSRGSTPLDLAPASDEDILRYVGEDECQFTSEGIDVDAVAEYTPSEMAGEIMQAIEHDDAATVVALAEAGFDLNTRLSSFGVDYAIHHAATHRTAPAQAAEALCAKGASTELVDGDGNNALHLAAAAGNVAVVDVFAQYGGFAATVARNLAGQTPRDVALGLAREHSDDRRYSEILSILGGGTAETTL
jgi:hypothetical protein